MLSEAKHLTIALVADTRVSDLGRFCEVPRRLRSSE